MNKASKQKKSLLGREEQGPSEDRHVLFRRVLQPGLLAPRSEVTGAALPGSFPRLNVAAVTMRPSVMKSCASPTGERVPV